MSNCLVPDNQAVKCWFKLANPHCLKSPSCACRSSRRSSESGSTVDSEVILEAERLELERQAVKELEIAISKPVAFSVRTNISFDAALYGLDAPSPSRVVSFGVKDFLHIKKRFNQDWWIGRLVRIGSPIGFIPSPAKLEQINSLMFPNSGAHFQTDFGTGTTTGVLQGPHSSKPGPGGFGALDSTLERGGNRGLLLGNDADHRGPVLTANRQRQSESPPPGFDMYDDDDYHDYPAPQPSENVAQSTGKKQPNQSGMVGNAKKKVFSKKNEFVPPYEIVPCMRPVVFVGPALKGYEVTDMMQKAIFDAMKKHFDGRIIVSRVSTNISLAKRVGALLHLDKKNVLEKGRSRQLVTLLEVQQDLERIFHLGSKMQLLLLDCDTINHPSQISKTCLAPIIIYIKIASTRVLNRLIKNRGKLQKKNAGVQTAAAEKLLQCSPESFDFVVDQNTLAAASEALQHFLEGYWAATHPPLVANKAERLLGSFSAAPEPHEPDSDRPLVPMTPGHPGLSVVTKSALDAGFTSQEISTLTGARATGWAMESGMQPENDIGLTGVHYGGGSLGSEYNFGHKKFGAHDHMVGDNDNPEFHHNRRRHEDDLDHDEENISPHPNYRRGRLQVGAAQAAAMAAVAAGLSPKPHAVHPSLLTSDTKLFHSKHADGSDQLVANSARGTPGLAMGLGLGLASGVAATINAALFQTLHHGNHTHASNTNIGGSHPNGMSNAITDRVPVPASTITAATAATIAPPPLKDLGIHQVEGSDGTQVYQSRSARQAKQRQAELDRVRQEAEAKALALQANVMGRRKRRERERRQRSAEAYAENRMDSNGRDQNIPRHHPNHDGISENGHAGYGVSSKPPVRSMARACPPDD